MNITRDCRRLFIWGEEGKKLFTFQRSVYQSSSLALDAEKKPFEWKSSGKMAAILVAQCSSCGLKEEFPVKPAQGEVDVYCMLTDRVYGTQKRTPITNVKKE